MRARYDSDANAISIELTKIERADRADQAHKRYGLDREALATAALAAPNRFVSVDVAFRPAA